MAQVLKHEVRERIVAAAARVFARQGAAAATVSGIAAAAGVSTGNLYRYFPTREALLAAVVPDALARRLAALLTGKVRALSGVSDIARTGERGPWRVASEELLAFAIEHRHGVVILLGQGRAEGTSHERFAQRMVERLVTLALGWAASVEPSLEVTQSARVALARIYRNLLETVSAILESTEDEAAIRDAVVSFSTYHLAGMKAFFRACRA